ncbi:hypothetical protein PAECIP111893_04171 [Paenibacillus plantiphilus]|uniref:YuzL-like protein n=1 Tax=Paenibacillus plantiphilus TaxID=2905650 RepID=A0ABN8GS63_9BACL|nr:hypothetical protein [Paenibacillus plantiphilus]CAH1216784.1 hypothetical protein PAECIP111893_04171 [Paenibacillus plantiphilus]
MGVNLTKQAIGSPSASNPEAARSNKDRDGKAPESAGFDKKLDGPNRPSI